MKWIRYKVLDREINHGTEEEPIIEQFFSEKGMTWSEANEEIAKREAYNGEYTIEDDDSEVRKPNPARRKEFPTWSPLWNCFCRG